MYSKAPHHPPSSVAEHLGKHQRPVGCGYQTHHGRERANDDGAAVPKQGNGEAAREKREADRGERRVGVVEWWRCGVVNESSFKLSDGEGLELE